MKLKTNTSTIIGGLLIVSSLLSPALEMTAANTEPSSPPKDIPVVKKNRGSISSRPKTPSRQEITCIYYDGNISVSFFLPEGECTMTVLDSTTMIAVEYMFSSEETADLYVGELNEAYIEFSTSAGNEYEGWLK